jgi:hypothetical protein
VASTSRGRFLLVVALAAVIVGIDLAVKTAVHTHPWHLHERSTGWVAGSFLLLGAALALARLPSRAVSLGAGMLAGGIAGNLLSAAANARRVPNPLVLGSPGHGVAFNVADVFLLAGNLLLVVSLGALAIRMRHRLLPPRAWEQALRLRVQRLASRLGARR